MAMAPYSFRARGCCTLGNRVRNVLSHIGSQKSSRPIRIANKVANEEYAAHVQPLSMSFVTL
eukprot:2758206-Lingulodinium_polyedra.AAC.1